MGICSSSNRVYIEDTNKSKKSNLSESENVRIQIKDSKKQKSFEEGLDKLDTGTDRCDYYKGAYKGLVLMCRDVFKSKYTQESMSKWRECSIVAIYHPNSVEIHFKGWKDKHNIILDLEKPHELSRLCPTGILRSKQIKMGLELTEEQLESTSKFFSTGHKLMKATSNSEFNDNDTDIKNGDVIDIQEVFGSPGRQRRESKWRQGVVKELSGNKVRISYIGLEDDWDEIIDLEKEGHRIRRDSSITNQVASLGSGTARNSDGTRVRRRSLGSVRGLAMKMMDDGDSDTGDNASRSPLDTLRNQLFFDRKDKTNNVNERGEGENNKNNTSTEETNNSNAAQGTEADDWMPDINYPETPATNMTGNSLESSQSDISTPEANMFSIGWSPTGDRKDSRFKSPNAGSSGKRRRGSRRNSRRRQSFPAPARTGYSEETFMENMANAGLYIVEMAADGNCLFRAVAHQIYMNAEKHHELRKQCVNHMRKHRDRFALFCTTDFDTYLNNLSRDGSWGDDLEIKALEEIIDRAIVIYSSENKDLAPMTANFDDLEVLHTISNTGVDTSDVTSKKDILPLKLSYHGQSHYNSVFDGTCPLPLKIRGTDVLLKHRCGEGG